MTCPLAWFNGLTQKCIIKNLNLAGSKLTVFQLPQSGLYGMLSFIRFPLIGDFKIPILQQRKPTNWTSFDCFYRLIHGEKGRSGQVHIYFNFTTFRNDLEDIVTETDKEVYKRELLNQPIRVQIASLQHTFIVSSSE